MRTREGLPGGDAGFRHRIDERLAARGIVPQLTDVYRLALAVKNGGALVTFDRTMSLPAVRGATEEHLVLL